MDHISRFIWLEEVVLCSIEVVAREVLKWCSSFGVPKAFASDNGTHFTRHLLQIVSRCGRVHYSVVANISWSNGTVERMSREVVEKFRAVLSEKQGPLSKQPLALRAL